MAVRIAARAAVRADVRVAAKAVTMNNLIRFISSQLLSQLYYFVNFVTSLVVSSL